MNEEQMERNLDRVNMWIGNCDQKAGLLLGFLGVAATLFITSDVVGKLRNTLIAPFIAYWRDDVGSFNLLRCLLAVCLLIGAVCIFIALMNLLFCLMAKTDYSKFKQLGMKEKSRLFFGHIASMTYDEFSLEDNDQLNDLRSQTYTNACICDSKFKHYNVALKCSLVAIPLFTLAFILTLFV